MKRCPRCGELKPEFEFGFRRAGGKPRQLRAYCRPCYQQVYHQCYLKNKDAVIQRANVTHAAIRALIRASKEVPCSDCGRTFPYYQMEFDHRDGEKKCFNIADVMGPCRVGKKRLLAEMAKCDVVCVYCHRERTHQRRLRARQERHIEQLAE